MKKVFSPTPLFIRKKSSSLAGLALLLACGASAASNPDVVALDPPAVARLDWNTRGLVSGDLNNDGLTDLAVINNDTAKIDLLYQTGPDTKLPPTTRSVRRNRWEPEVEDAPFARGAIVTGLNAYALTVGDLNNDGRNDIAYTGNIDPLTIRYQAEDGTWAEEWTHDGLEPMQWVSTLAVADLNADERNDLVVLGNERLFVFYQNERNTMDEPVEYRVPNTTAFDLRVDDINRDGKPDLVYLTGSNQDRSVAVRFQYPEGGFGPEHTFEIENGSSRLVPVPSKDGKKDYVFIDGKTSMVRWVSFATAEEPPQKVRDLRALVYSTGTSSRDSAIYAMADFDRNGSQDLAVADPRGARILLFLQNQQGDFSEPQEFPSLTKISSLSVLEQADGSPQLLIVSEEEKIAGTTTYDVEKKRLPFPDLFPTNAMPLLAVSHDWMPTEGDEVLMLQKDSGGKYELELYARTGEDQAWESALFLTLTSLERDPLAMDTLDLDVDGTDDLVLFLPRSPARLFLWKQDHFTEAAKDSPLRKGSLSDLDPEDIASISEGFMTAQTGLLRALKVNEEGDLTVIDQFNARNRDARPLGALTLDFDGQEGLEILYYDENAEALELLKQAENGVYEWMGQKETGYLDIVGSSTIELSGNAERPSPLFMGSDRFWVFPLDRPAWMLEPARADYETDLDEVRYTSLDTGDLNSDGKLDLILVDGRKNLIEVLTPREDGGLESLMHFIVFDQNIHYSGRRGGSLEPRELLVTDVTNDGRDDLVLLVHDRVLFYKQVKPEVLSAND